jgi:hypothetical protein
MKRILLFILLSFLFLSVQGQISRYPFYRVSEIDTCPNCCAEYEAVWNAFTTKPHDTIAVIQNTLVYSLDTAGFWDRTDVLYVFAAHNSTDALINWKNPGTYNADNPTATTWTQWEGFQGDGTADYISTNWTPDGTGNYKLDDAAIGIYLRIDEQQDDRYVYGAVSTGTNNYFRVRSTTDGLGGAINSSSTFAAAGSTISSGLWINTRRASNITESYRNGESKDEDTDLSTSLATVEFIF